MILRFLNVQGIAGIAVGLALAVLLVVQKGETRHWRKQSSQFEQLYHSEQSAFAGTVANYRAAAEGARAADLANLARVAAQQDSINERTAYDFQARLAAARAAAQRLRVDSTAATDPSARANAPMPGLSAAASRPPQAPGEDRLSAPDALTATEQAIQLDELIKWVRRQAAVPTNGGPDAQQAAVDIDAGRAASGQPANR
ncbi:MAG: hypothetical protein V4502_11050 [Pseudomonadota bacterium]